jgi:hypothetical protein
VLLELPIELRDVEPPVMDNGVTSMSGAGARADLSCGRLDVWVGAPMLGPAPDGGVPGDCEPCSGPDRVCTSSSVRLNPSTRIPSQVMDSVPTCSVPDHGNA